MATDQVQTVIDNENNDTDITGKETDNITMDEEQDAHDQQLADEASAADTKPIGVVDLTGVIDSIGVAYPTEEYSKQEDKDDAEVTKHLQK